MTFKPHDYQQDAMAHIYATRRCALWMLANQKYCGYVIGKTFGAHCG